MQPNRVAADPVSARGMALPYRRARNLVVSKREGNNGAGPTYFVKTAAKQVFQFGEEEHLLCELLDGKRAFPEIQSEFRRQIGSELTREQFDGFLNEMLECEIVEPFVGETTPAPGPAKPVENEPRSLPEPRPLEAEPPDDIDLAIDDDEIDVPALRAPVAVRLFDPAGLLKTVDWLGGPLRFYRWLLLPASFACLIATALNGAALGADLAGLSAGHAIAMLAAAVLVVGLVPAIAQAATASYLGFPSQACTVAFRFHLLPHLCFSQTEWGDLRAAEALVVTAAPLTARLALFTAGTGFWLLTRQALSPGSENWLPVAALVIGQMALCALLCATAPFAATSGGRWLATLFGRADLWRSGGVYRSHLMALSGLWGLGCLGLVLFYLGVAAHAGALLTVLQRAAPQLGSLDMRLPGLGPGLQSLVLPLLIIVPVASWLWLRATVKSHGVTRVTYRTDLGAPNAQAPAIKPPGVVVPLNREGGPGGLPSRRLQTDRWPSKMTVLLATLAALFLAIGMLPYAYEAGGYFTILPHDSSKLNARIAGELTEVTVNEGDKVVPGQILGILSDWDEQANLDVSKAQLENAKANLQALYETPKPEDVELSRKQYELANSKLAYDKAQYDRAAVLVKTDAVSRSNYDQVLSQYQQDQAAADVARANYDDVRAGPTPAQFDAARALLRQSAATVAYNEDQLERTRIRATSSGEVVTPNPMLLRGQYFAEGGLVFTVQDLSSVQADVQVSEDDIGHVIPGGVTRLRAWGYPETTFLGQAVAIASDAQTDPTSGSNIVRVRTEVPNPDGALHPTMTGYAKITGYYMPFWKACLMMLVRFFLIDVWSFIP